MRQSHLATKPSVSKVALVFGISGQDGAYLAKLLLAHGYNVHGTSRDKEMSAFENLKKLGIFNNVSLHSTALNDFRSVLQTVSIAKPDEIYNLASQSSVGLSFQQPVETMESCVTGTLNILEAIRLSRREVRFYSASSSECFGDTFEQPATETTNFQPRSPYGVAKAAAYWLVANYRNSYELFACSGILFNHESPLRPSRFVTKKIVEAAVDIYEKKRSELVLGNLEITRDWGWAPEYVEAMWLMLQQGQPQDYVIATGRPFTLRQFVESVFERLGLSWKDHVSSDKTLFRPTDLKISVGNPDRAASELNWKAKTTMPALIDKLVEAELDIRGILPPASRYRLST